MMFGHDEKQHQDDHTAPQPDASLTQDASIAMPTDTSAPAPALQSDDDTAGDYIMTDSPKPLTDDSAVQTPAPAAEPSSTVLPREPATAAPAGSDELLSIKQKALTELTPLVDHLDQTAEERFRTTMMMIQASDNDALIPAAYKAAQEITDEKVRAQALLDIVNEINYFTQQHEA